MMAALPKLEIVRRVTLAELAANPSAAEGLSREAVAELRGELARLDTLLLGHLLAPAKPDTEDRMLDVEDAAGKLGMSRDYLYRHAASLPFTRRIGRKLLFSSHGIDKYILSR